MARFNRPARLFLRPLRARDTHAIPAPEIVCQAEPVHELGLSDARTRDDQVIRCCFRRLQRWGRGRCEGPLAGRPVMPVITARSTPQCRLEPRQRLRQMPGISRVRGVFRGQLALGDATQRRLAQTIAAALWTRRAALQRARVSGQEFMHALGVPTSRSLMLVMSRGETVRRHGIPRSSRVVRSEFLVTTGGRSAHAWPRRLCGWANWAVARFRKARPSGCVERTAE